MQSVAVEKRKERRQHGAGRRGTRLPLRLPRVFSSPQPASCCLVLSLRACLPTLLLAACACAGHNAIVAPRVPRSLALRVAARIAALGGRSACRARVF